MVWRRRRRTYAEAEEAQAMNRSIFLLGAALAISSANPASAATVTAPFGCEARKPSVCYFRIFFGPRNSRQVVLPAGIKEKIPGVTIGRDQYCVSLDRPPRHSCAKKLIKADYNY